MNTGHRAEVHCSSKEERSCKPQPSESYRHDNPALCLAITAVPEVKAGGASLNNNCGGVVVINRRYTYDLGGYYKHGPNYYRGCGVVAGPNGACSRGHDGRGGCVRY